MSREIGAARIALWVKDLDWYETICIHEHPLREQIMHLVIDARGVEFAKCLEFRIIRGPQDLIPLRGLKFGINAWPHSLDNFPPFVIAEYCALKEKAEAKKARTNK